MRSTYASRSSLKLARTTLSKIIHSRTPISSVSWLALSRANMLFRTLKTGTKIPIYENTYRLESYNPFNPEVVDKILIDVMETYVNNLKYHPQICMQICQYMSLLVRNRICEKKYDRYKFIVVMSIVQKLGQDVQINFGKLWDINKDSYSTYVIEKPEFAVMGLVVAIYYE